MAARGLCFHRPTLDERGCQDSRVYVYFDRRDLWIGAYVAEDAVYVCILPTFVIRWRRGDG